MSAYFTEPYVKYIHCIVLNEASKLDAVYEDYILKLVGIFGLQALKDCGLIEPCGVVNGRQLYSIM